MRSGYLFLQSSFLGSSEAVNVPPQKLTAPLKALLCCLQRQHNPFFLGSSPPSEARMAALLLRPWSLRGFSGVLHPLSSSP